MSRVTGWARRRRWTLSLAIFFSAWYILQLSVFQVFGEGVARWWFYFEQPPNSVSPGVLLAPLSHDMYTFTHIGANLVFLLIAGGLVEPYAGKEEVLISVIGLGYLGVYLANVTAVVHKFWILAGASGGILALMAYAGLELRQQKREPGSLLSPEGVEAVGATFVLLSIPVFLIHQIFFVNQPHSGHVIGLLLGCSYYGIKSRQ